MLGQHLLQGTGWGGRLRSARACSLKALGCAAAIPTLSSIAAAFQEERGLRDERPVAQSPRLKTRLKTLRCPVRGQEPAG